MDDDGKKIKAKKRELVLHTGKSGEIFICCSNEILSEENVSVPMCSGMPKILFIWNETTRTVRWQE